MRKVVWGIVDKGDNQVKDFTNGKKKKNRYIRGQKYDKGIISKAGKREGYRT